MQYLQLPYPLALYGKSLIRRVGTYFTWLESHTVTAHPNQRLFTRWCLYKGLDVCSLQTCAGTKARASGETKRECALTNFSSTEAASPLVCRCKPSSVLPMVRRWRNPKAQALVLFLQYFNFSLELCDLFCGMLFCHIDKLTASRMRTTIFLRKSV
jgi:hypothetical protein